MSMYKPKMQEFSNIRPDTTFAQSAVKRSFFEKSGGLTIEGEFERRSIDLTRAESSGPQFDGKTSITYSKDSQDSLIKKVQNRQVNLSFDNRQPVYSSFQVKSPQQAARSGISDYLNFLN